MMGYKVMCYPNDKPAGYLERGKVQPPHLTGTYFDHPSSARLSATRWVLRTKGYADVLTWKDNVLVETVRL